VICELLDKFEIVELDNSEIKLDKNSLLFTTPEKKKIKFIKIKE
jgi:hypothetical protein